MTTESIDPDVRALIERARMVNKVLSLYVLALQEHDSFTIEVEGELGIAAMLVGLGEIVRTRAAERKADDNQRDPTERSSTFTIGGLLGAGDLGKGSQRSRP